MIKNINLNLKISLINGLTIIRKYTNKGTIDITIESIENGNKKKDLESKKYVNSKKALKNLQNIIELSDIIINKSELNLKNKNKLNLKLLNSENFKNNLTETKKLNSIVKNEQQYIKLITPFNSKIANFTNNMYTFTNRSFKQINKILYSLYVICYSAFVNMSSIISKPIISMNPNLMKITLFFYWKPLREIYYSSNSHSKFLILYNNKLDKLVKLLSKLFKKPIELELIRIYSPQNESNILANLIGNLSNFIKFRNIYMKLLKLSKTKNISKGFNYRFSNNSIPSFLSGIYLKLAGRVLTQKSQKRVKSKIVQKGSLARTNVNLISTNRFVNKNKKGSFSITIKTGHIVND
uniref:Small ribosomal subunit protein uS3m n=1 Tax=Lactifluus volemus TaxID=71967 RepID=A0A2Z4M8R0_9AGAM|nr:ribosomal protein S3 [Lactifluus volemus]AWX52870.1 ribosomal protein S3 [Lactifluus volemus]